MTRPASCGAIIGAALGLCVAGCSEEGTNPVALAGSATGAGGDGVGGSSSSVTTGGEASGGVGGGGGGSPERSLRAKQVSVGLDYACAVLEDQRVACWGEGEYGLLGDGDVTKHDVLVPRVVAGLSGVKQVVAGWLTTCALLDDATVRCWGVGYAGQLGDGIGGWGHLTGSPTPVVSLENVAQIDAYFGLTCAVVEDGRLFCWGFDRYDTLPDPELCRAECKGEDGPVPCALVCHTTPKEVPNVASAMSVGVGRDHACALMSEGTVACWGDGSGGELGDGTLFSQEPVPFPQEVPGLAGVVQLSVGEQHTCVLGSAGEVSCWGVNYHGEVGVPATNQWELEPSPVTVPALAPCTSIATGAAQTSAVTINGDVYRWGDHLDALPYLTAPTVVPDITTPLDGAMGSADVFCVILPTGVVACSGQNGHGQLGDGTTTARAQFAPVLSPEE